MKINIKETSNKSYQYLTYLTSTFSFFFILPSILLKKIIVLPVVGSIPISILFTGVYFMLLDVITEVYGYKEGKRTLFSALMCYTFFVFIMESIIQIPSPVNSQAVLDVGHDPNIYNYIFNNLYLVWISVMICGLVANTLNMIVLSKWKSLLKGKYFWMRSVTTSFVVLIFYTLLSNYFAFSFNNMQCGYYCKLVLVSLVAKLLTLILFAYPATMLCAILKYKEGVDVYDHTMKIDLSFT
jgi:queuosine precursor transporter